MRGVTLPSGKKVILSDTVGFISDLPTQLVAAFRATLEEVLEADLILHVRDIAHPESEEQAADVRDILESLGVSAEVPLFEVWNKIDLLPEDRRAALAQQDARTPGVHIASALTGEGIGALLAAVSAALDEARRTETLTLGFDEGRARAWLHAEGVVKAEAETEGGHRMTVALTERQRTSLARLRPGQGTAAKERTSDDT